MRKTPWHRSRRHLLKGLASGGVVIGLYGCKGRDVDSSRDSVPGDSGDSSPDDTRLDSEHSDDPVDLSEFNVLTISADELHPGFLGFMGHPDARTPNLDALRAQSLLCTRVYVSYPICAPTRSSLLTGLFPQEHGQFYNNWVLHEGYDTFPAHFARGGFRTACFGKLHTQNDEATNTFGFGTLLSVESGAPWEAVWERYAGELPRSDPDPADEAVLLGCPYSGFTGRPLADPNEDDDYILVQEAIAWMREHAGERFFLYVSMRSPHYPWDLPSAWYYLHEPSVVTLPEVDPEDYKDSFGAVASMRDHDWSTMTEEQSRLCMARYLGAIAWHDHLVGLLLAALEELGLSQKTLVAWTSDHGDMAGEKGLWLKKVMFDAAARKPLLLRMPGVLPEGGSSDVLLSEVDLWATMGGLVGMQQLPGVRGRDRSAALLGLEEGPQRVFAVAGIEEWDGHPWMVMCREARYKFVRYRPAEGHQQGLELYDMDVDPNEVVNLAYEEGYAAVVDELSVAVDIFLSSVQEPAFPQEKVDDSSE